MRTAWFFAIFLGGILAACKKEPEPAHGSPLLPKAAPATSLPAPVPALSAASAEAFPLGITWEDPPGWTRVPGSSAVRKATYRPPRAAGDKEDAELAVFYFGPGQGGSVEANVDRWIKQFTDLKSDAVRREDREAHGLRQHTVAISKGTFSSGMPGASNAPKKDYALLGGIVEAPSGTYFFKLTGPAASVAAARPAFMKLLDSVKTAS
jgi:hypothetical protein